MHLSPKLADAIHAGALQRVLLESEAIACVVTDERGEIVMFNVGAQRAWGYAAADVVGVLTLAVTVIDRDRAWRLLNGRLLNGRLLNVLLLNVPLLNVRLPDANEEQVCALHERTTVGSAAAGALRDNQLRCAACRCGEAVVAARHHYGRPRPRSADAGKHGTHREHGSRVSVER